MTPIKTGKAEGEKGSGDYYKVIINAETREIVEFVGTKEGQVFLSPR